MSPAELVRVALLAVGAPPITEPPASLSGPPSATDSDDAWPCYVSSMPDSNDSLFDRVACLYDTPGRESRRIASGEHIGAYGLQVRVRSISYQEGWTKILAICKALEQINYQTVEDENEDEMVIQSLNRTSPPASIGAEPGTKRRENFTANFLVWLQGV